MIGSLLRQIFMHFITAPFKRGPYRPLSARQPERAQSQKVPLGFEGLDMNAVNAAARRNDALERSNGTFMHRGSFAASASTHVNPLADDETYAAKYHRAFQKQKDTK